MINQSQQQIYLHQQQQQQQTQPQQQQQQFNYQQQYNVDVQQDPMAFQQQHQEVQDNQQLGQSILEQLLHLDQLTNETANELNKCRLKGEEFNLAKQTAIQIEYQLDNLVGAQIPNPGLIQEKENDKIQCRNNNRRLYNDLKVMCKSLCKKLFNIFEQLSDIQNKVLNERLPAWHQEQQLSSSGPNQVDTTILDQLQTWIEMISSIIWRLRVEVKVLHQLANFFHHEPDLTKNLCCNTIQLGIKIDKSLEQIVLKAFIVEKQPPQVMKTNTRFTSTVRFLGGNKLSFNMSNPTVRVTILSEANARLVIQRHKDLISNSWSFSDNQHAQQQSSRNDQHIAPTPQGVIPQRAQSTSPIQQAQQFQQHYPTSYGSVPMDASVDGQQFQAPPSSNQPVINSNSQQQFFEQQQQFYNNMPTSTQHDQQYPQQQQQHLYHNQQQQQRQLMDNLKILNISEFESSGEIVNGCNNLEYHESGQIVWHFRNMQLKKIKRTEKKGTESVMDEKFVLLFHTEFRVGEGAESSPWSNRGDLSFHMMAFSLPVVVIVHGNQEPHAVATVTWHNAFATPSDLLYYVPEKVPWPALGHVLSERFRACAGKGLTCQNLEYLAAKVTKNTLDSSINKEVTWNQFAKETLPDKNFTFWEWFYSILKLTREHLSKLWEADKIYGFIGKKGCEDLLLSRSYQTDIDSAPVGTFILRFSETELGGITIAWVSSNLFSQKKNGYGIGGEQMNTINEDLTPANSVVSPQQHQTSTALTHLQPFTSKDLNTRPLSDRIRDLHNLVYLYPDIPKDEAFGEYYTPLTDNATHCSTTGYVKPMLIQALVENYTSRNVSVAPSPMLDTNLPPSTPNSYSQSSPNEIYHNNELMDSSYSAYADQS